MIGNIIKYLCNEDISLIENYDKAIADTTQVWHLHHRLETDKNLSAKELMSMKMYYHRPASELIFLTPFEHYNLHFKDKPRSEATKAKMRKPRSEEAKANMRKPKSEEAKANMRKPKSKKTRKKMSESAKKRKPRSEESRKKQSESMKCKYWINNGKNQKRISKDQLLEYLDKGYKLGRK